MAFTKGIAAGFVATVVLSALMVAKEWMGVMPDLNVIALLTGLSANSLGTPPSPAVGWVIHFAIGTLAWGSLFAWTHSWMPGGHDWSKGMVFASLAWLAMMIVVMPLAGMRFFGLEGGWMAPIASLVLHWIYGLVLGAAYHRLTATRPAPEGDRETSPEAGRQTRAHHR